ncbi:hypothetical protein PUN28_005656 [Cardiocondyla obscurior]|uniref:Uncharacterized protein n=1 Tax=Cardiocondyla obscurior TaxID=286306 RepID=A0AAW2GB18_9HYME
MIGKDCGVISFVIRASSDATRFNSLSFSNYFRCFFNQKCEVRVRVIRLKFNFPRGAFPLKSRPLRLTSCDFGEEKNNIIQDCDFDRLPRAKTTDSTRTRQKPIGTGNDILQPPFPKSQFPWNNANGECKLHTVLRRQIFLNFFGILYPAKRDWSEGRQQGAENEERAVNHAGKAEAVERAKDEMDRQVTKRKKKKSKRESEARRMTG